MTTRAPCEFKDLCLDVNDTSVVAPFWASVLGLSVEDRGANARLVDETDAHALWLNPVPELKTVKHRVHLDVHAADAADLVAAGASILDESQPWTVLGDPEDGEFCAFVRPPDQLPGYRLFQLVVDARDPDAIAGWWADRFETEPQQQDVHEFRWLKPGSGGLPWDMVFNPVPEAKTVKNRLHWDVWGDTTELLIVGARLIRRRDDEIDWDVMADPEGNEFCVFTRDRGRSD